MIGKLQVWRGEHRKDAQDKIRVGGFVSYEELERKAKSPSPNKSAARKRAPRLSISRRSFSLGTSKPGEDPFLPPLESHDLSLFSNIPAANSVALDRPPSSSGFQLSPTRPQTADPDFSLNPLRSKSIPPIPIDSLRSPWADKPLPLAIDFDQARKRSSSISSQRPSIQTLQDDRSSFGVSVPRPKTSSSADPSHRRKRSGSFTRPSAAPTYSLTPTITPQHSRRPSMTALPNQSHRTSRENLNKSNSTASTSTNGVHGNRTSASSRASTNTQTTPKANGIRSPTDSSILDEVEGTLSATITELQELQTGYSDDYSFNLSTAQRRRPTEPPKSAPANQGFFAQRSQYPPTSSGTVSLPPTPIVAISDDSDDRLQSIQAAYDKQKRDMHTVLVENETLKKQLSLVQTRLADIDTIRIERDQLAQALQESQVNLKTMLDKLKLSRDNEEASLNNLSAVTARLDEANMHRIDVLDHHHELEDKMKLLEEQHKALKEEKERIEQEKIAFEADRSVLHQEIAKLRQRPPQSLLDAAQNSLRVAEERAMRLEKQVKSGDGRADLPSIVADLGFKMEDLQRTLCDRDRHIAELEATSKSVSKGAQSEKMHANKIRGLERTVAEQHKTFRAIQAERDQLRQLIYAEFRRTANEVQKRQHPATTLLEKKVEVDTAILEVRKKAREFLSSQKRRDEDPNLIRAVRIEELQQEIDYHVKDIVLYKLDVKGYKKDLKRAQIKLQRLEAMYSHGNGLISQFSSRDIRETRPSLSSQNSDHSVQQVLPATEVLSDGDNTPPREERRGKRLSVHAYSPDESPTTSPRKEKKQFNFVGAGI